METDKFPGGRRFPGKDVTQNAMHMEFDWNEIVRTISPPLLLFVRQYVKTIHDAEAIVQEAFIRLWRKGLPPGQNLRTHLYTLARSAALDHLRSSSRRRNRESTWADTFIDPEPMFESSLDQEGVRAQADELLQNLPPEQKEVVVMKIWGEMTFREIAEVLQLSQGTAASRYRLAMETMRKALNKETSNGR